MQAAKGHVVWMDEEEIFDHYGPNRQTWIDRAIAAGYPSQDVGENIAWGMRDAKECFDAWMNSPGHRRTILTPRYRYMGFARSGQYWCLDVGS